MLRKFAINCISDEIHHPIITKVYRAVLIVSILLLVLINLAQNKYALHLYDVEYFLSFLLVIDFILRVIGSTKHYNMENDEQYNSLNNYLFSYYGYIDFISTMPFFFIAFHFENHDIKLIFTIITTLKLARFSPALIVLKDVIISERKPLLASLYLMMILTLSISTILYFVERDANPQGFASLLDSIWWAVITLATVGYGDVVPHTELGKLLGSIAAITGFGMFALPAGILASGFSTEIKKLRDMTSWQMVAAVPLFSELEFGVIADITKLLHIKRFRKNELIIKEGFEGDSMYFILEGSVLVYKNGLSVVLNSGDFFGEIALIKHIPRTANVTAKTRCELLELTTYDFQNLMKNKPELFQKIQEVAALRYEQ